MSTYRYFLKADWQEVWDEVTREQFIAAERAAGFRPKGGGDGLATAGFSGGGVRGRIEVVPDEETEEDLESVDALVERRR